MECWHGMSLTEQTIGTWLADDELPLIVRELFADVSPAGVAAALREMEVRLLGDAIERTELFGAGVGCVHGGRLPDGRRVVVKLHAPRVSVPFLEAMQEVQRHLSADGFPCPRPLAGPLRFERATATAESLLDRGTDADAHDPAVRRAMAAALAWLIERCRPLVALEALREHPMRVPAGRAVAGAARAALRLRGHERRRGVDRSHRGRGDGRSATAAAATGSSGTPTGASSTCASSTARSARSTTGTASSIAREPALVGAAAYAFTANWSREDLVYLPTLEEALAFVADYEEARGRRRSRGPSIASHARPSST